MSLARALRSAEALETHSLFAEAVSATASREHIFRFLRSYVEFNHPFAAGVLNLACAIHLNEFWFQPGADGALTSAGSASIVASHVLAAAEDEFAAPDGQRITHRMMADRLVSRIGPVDASDFCQELLNEGTRTLTELGYGVGASWTPEMLGRGIGFHVASEYSGGIEFSILDNHLRPMAKSLSLDLDEDIYRWISLHVSVELEHFAMAERAAELTIRYCPDIDIDMISAGVSQFYAVLRTFSASLTRLSLSAHS